VKNKPCSICGFAVAWCVDPDDKGTYWLCGECAVDYYRDKIKSERALLRVARAAEEFHVLASAHWTSLANTMEEYEDIRVAAYNELIEALKEVEHLLD